MTEKDDIIKLYAQTEGNKIELPNGKEAFTDLEAFFNDVDLFASRYGLGGCKSLEEFADMVNDTDPMFLNCLREIAIRNHNRMWAGDDDDDIPKKENEGDYGGFVVDSEEPPVVENSRVGRKKLRDFLVEMGADEGKVNKAVKDLEHRKIKFNDYSKLNKDSLADMSENEFKNYLKMMKEDRQKCINFEVSDDTLRAKERKHLEKMKNAQ